MPGPKSISHLCIGQEPLIRILAEMVDSALKWESEHGGEAPAVLNQLTEQPADIDLITTELLSTDADQESSP